MPDIDFQRIVLNLIPKKEDEPVVFFASQYETARPFIADLMWGESEFTPGDSCWAEIDIRKVDDNLVVITDDVTIDNNEVSVVLPVQALTCVGDNFGQIKIYADVDTLVAALNFILRVQPDPLAGGVTSETAIDNLTTQIDDIISGEGYVKDTDLDVLQSDWDEADPTSPAYIKNKPSSGTQVQADWTEADITSPAYIQNKPTLAAVATSGDYDDLIDKPTLATVATSGSYNDLTDKPTIPAAQIQSDYAQTNSSAVDYIKNKPELPFEDKGQYLLETTPANKRSIEFTTLIGGTCGVNQLADIDSSSWTSNGLTVTANNGRIQVSGTADNTSTFSLFPSAIFNKLKLIKNHKYMLYINGTHNFNDFYYGIYGDITQTVNLSSSTIFVCNADNVTDSEIIASATANESYTADFYFYVIDLTAYFGSTIADYVYNLENS